MKESLERNIKSLWRYLLRTVPVHRIVDLKLFMLQLIKVYVFVSSLVSKDEIHVEEISRLVKYLYVIFLDQTHRGLLMYA